MLNSCVLFLSSRLTFTNPDKEDLGRYSVVVTDTDGVSGSHTLTEDGKSGGSQNPRKKITSFCQFAHVCFLGSALQL